MTVATLTIPLGFQVERTSERRAYRSGREGGSIRARQVQERELRRWRIRRDDGHEGDVYLVMEAWNRARATADIDWTPPDEIAIRARFTGPPSIVHRGHVSKSVEFELEEVL